MAQITIENLSFSYPDANKESLLNVNIEVEEGEFVVICGKSGCGKTTLLRSIKNTLRPNGEYKGIVRFEGLNVEELSNRTDAKNIGFVFQQPAHQLVTDKVWHELAFGLENLGLTRNEIKLRVAETADYFGLREKLNENVEYLSGGQKQLLNIASVVIMQPKIVLLDEPTAQLDPIAAEHLLSTIYKINRDFGTTIIMSEHRLGGVMSLADKMIVMDDGKVIAEGVPSEIACTLENNKFFEAMPEAVKLYVQFEDNPQNSPLTVGDARRWLAGHNEKEKIYKTLEYEMVSDEKKLGKKFEKVTEQISEKAKGKISARISVKKSEKVKSQTDVALSCKDIWYRYERNSVDIVKGLHLNVDKSEIFGLVGGNGAGKSTMLGVLCGILKPYRGKVKSSGKVCMLSQDVSCLFLKDTVKEELETNSQDRELIQKTIEELELREVLEQHPYDLSGGQQQRLGIARLLLAEPEIILLDEPTKGMDEAFKNYFGTLLNKWKCENKTILIVSHDIEFLAKHADRCGMFFEGELIGVAESREFFKGKRYYTTDRERILNRHG